MKLYLFTQWPDLEEFKESLENKLSYIEDSAIPKHGQTSTVQRYLDSLVLPDIDFSQVLWQVITILWSV